VKRRTYRSRVGRETRVDESSQKNPDHDESSLRDTQKGCLERVEAKTLQESKERVSYCSRFEGRRERKRRRTLMMSVLKFEIPPLGMLAKKPRRKKRY